MRGRTGEINKSLYCTCESGESAYHGRGRGRSAGVEKQKSARSKFSPLVFEGGVRVIVSWEGRRGDDKGEDLLSACDGEKHVQYSEQRGHV